jgi:hypothetical protein
MVHCSFLGNFARTLGGGAFMNGAVRDCSFVENESGSHASGLGLVQGSARDSLFIGNTAIYGGALYVLNDQVTDEVQVHVLDCLVIGNTSTGGNAAGVVNERVNTVIADTLIAGNHGASGAPGGLLNYLGSRLTVVNCVVSGNTTVSSASPGGIMIGYDAVETTLLNSIVWGNANSAGNGEPSQLEVHPLAELSIDYSCVQGWTGSLGGVGNFGDDPLFVDPDGPDGIPGTEDDDLRLSPGSPCIDAGFNNAVPLDVLDLDGDGVTEEFIPFDLDGQPRFADDPDAPDAGCGVGAIVDIGAYEFQGEPATIVPADLTGDGLVDMIDLMQLIAAWGDCPTEPPTCCLADHDADGVVSIVDLLAMLAHWG